jgi:hypothetical protein
MQPATRLAGRQAELARLASAIAAAAGSRGTPHRPGLVSISGEAGIGKTRLAEEAAAAARARGFAVLVGAAYPLGTAVAYGPCWRRSATTFAPFRPSSECARPASRTWAACSPTW